MMMSAERGNYIGLSRVGSRIWELIEQPRDLDDVCAILEAEFAVEPERCRAEVMAFVRELEAHDAVTLDTSAAG